MTGKRGPKAKFCRTRDTAALFYALRRDVGYRPAIEDVSNLMNVPPRNIERELDPATTWLSAPFAESAAMCAIAAHQGIIRHNLKSYGEPVTLAKWPDTLRAMVKALAGN